MNAGTILLLYVLKMSIFNFFEIQRLLLDITRRVESEMRMNTDINGRWYFTRAISFFSSLCPLAVVIFPSAVYALLSSQSDLTVPRLRQYFVMPMPCRTSSSCGALCRHCKAYHDTSKDRPRNHPNPFLRLKDQQTPYQTSPLNVVQPTQGRSSQVISAFIESLYEQAEVIFGSYNRIDKFLF